MYMYHHQTLTHSYGNVNHSAYVLVEVLSVRGIGNLLCVDSGGGSSGQIWFMTSSRDFSCSCQSSLSVLASSVTGGLIGQSSLTFFSAKVAGAKILALGLYSGASITVSAMISDNAVIYDDHVNQNKNLPTSILLTDTSHQWISISSIV